MTEGARRKPATRAPSLRTRAHWRALVVGAALALAVGSLAGCSGDARSRESRRKDVGETDTRGQRTLQPVDTTSLVTPVRADTLIGAARGAGGETSLRTTCAICHEGSHAVQSGRDASTSSVCVSCHVASHEPIEAFYAGTGRGGAVAPDTMFLARVSCVACHTDTTFAAPPGAARAAAFDRMCTSCHGTRFRGMLASWQNGVTWRARDVAAYVRQASADPRLAGTQSRARLRAAERSLALLRAAGAVHNVHGADGLLRAALDTSASAYVRAGLSAPSRPSLGPNPARNQCLTCHYGVESARAVVGGQTFNHESHIIRSDLACLECHSNATYFKNAADSVASANKMLDARHGQTTLAATACESCHHSPTARVTCTTCHTDVARLARPLRVTMAMKLQPAKAPTRRSVEFRHDQHATTECASCHTSPNAVRQVAPCSSCHTDHHKAGTARCASCHGTTSLTSHTIDNHFKCASCHVRGTVAALDGNRAFCVSCHVKQVDHEPGRECSTCHLRLSPVDVRRRILADQSRPVGSR